MTIRHYRENLLNVLEDIYPQEELNSFTVLLLGHFMKYSRIDISLNEDDEIPTEHIRPLKDAILKLKKQVPIQYIIGNTEFMDLNLKVDNSVLIPRPETEDLVRMIIEDHRFCTDRLSIMDIGTGSGCIAISLAKNIPDADLVGVDISEEALSLATENAKLNDVQINFKYCDILNWEESELQNDELLDIIVSNPPYVRLSEKQKMENNVLNHEPHLALFVDDNDPLLFYREIANFAQYKLKDHGALYFEINEYLSKELESMLKQVGFSSVVIFKDIFGKDRMVKATKT